jgi:NADPH:quinone reductase-like Zn-dependent oxidoreductase
MPLLPGRAGTTAAASWELLGETRRGTYAEYVVVPAGNLLALPPVLSPPPRRLPPWSSTPPGIR